MVFPIGDYFPETEISGECHNALYVFFGSKQQGSGWRVRGHFRRARYRAREYLISLSCSIQNIKSLRQILVILGRSNCLVAVRLDVPEARRLSFKP